MLANTTKKVMLVGKATTFMVGLAVILALTVGLASSALAGTGVGATFNLGKTNTVNAITKLAGSVVGPSLTIDNNSADPSATALDLQVEPGKAPMKVNSGTKVPNLNSDTVDGKHADQLVRVASFTGPSPLAAGANGTVATTTINAPAPGFLVIDASSDVLNSFQADVYECSVQVDNATAPGSRRAMALSATQPGVNFEENCSTNAVVPVSAGTHTVDLEATLVSDANTRWKDTALSAIYVPFDGSGAQR
jgi:hypothetical protein